MSTHSLRRRSRCCSRKAPDPARSVHLSDRLRAAADPVVPVRLWRLARANRTHRRGAEDRARRRSAWRRPFRPRAFSKSGCRGDPPCARRWSREAYARSSSSPRFRRRRQQRRTPRSRSSPTDRSPTPPISPRPMARASARNGRRPGLARNPGADRGSACIAFLVQSRAQEPLLPGPRIDRHRDDDDRNVAHCARRRARMGARHDGGDDGDADLAWPSSSRARSSPISCSDLPRWLCAP